MADLNVTPLELHDAGVKICKYADEIQEVTTKLKRIINELNGRWTGLAADAYYQTFKKVENELTQFPDATKSLGDTIQGAATKFSETDEAVLKRF